MFVSCNFYPRPPRGGRRLGAIWMMLSLVISTHALREEGDRNCSSLRCALLISTHALREEGDVAGPSSGLTASNFYPRPP